MRAALRDNYRQGNEYKRQDALLFSLSPLPVDTQIDAPRREPNFASARSMHSGAIIGRYFPFAATRGRERRRARPRARYDFSSSKSR